MTQSLTERLEKRLASQSAEIEALTAAELKRLGMSLRTECERELNSIKRAIHDQSDTTESLRTMLRWPLWTAAGCIVIVTACLALLWAGTWWIRSDLDDLRSQVKAQREALAQIEAQTGGITFQRSQQGLFVVLPSTAQTDTFWTCGERRCLKLRD